MSTDKYVTITAIHREDLQEFLSDEELAHITDEDMETIAAAMAEAYTEFGSFWSDLCYFTREVLAVKTEPERRTQKGGEKDGNVYDYLR